MDSLQDCQRRVDEWIRSVGVRYFSELTNTALLMEEVGELARIMARPMATNRQNQATRKAICPPKWQTSSSS